MEAERLAQEIMKRAEACGVSIVTAESCTAGRIAHLLADVPGAGKYFHGGFVTYTKAMKTAALGVSAQLLKDKTAVCAEVAAAMAQGAVQHSPAQLAVAVTGVAGPDPDEDGNPVGLIYCAVAREGGETITARLEITSRKSEQILDEAIVQSLTLLHRQCC